MAETFTPIGTSTDWWFWSLKPFKGKLYAGTYKMEAPKIYNYSPWTLLKTFSGNGTPGESVLRLVEFNNEFYANSECMGNEGHTYRMTTADPTEWTSVHHEVGWYPKPLIVFNGYFYAGWFHPTNGSGDIKIVRSLNGTSWSQCKTWTGNALISFFIYKNQLYIISWSDITGKSWGARTSNGTDWSDVPILCGRDYGWTYGVVFEDKVYIGQVGKSIYRYDETNLDKVLEVNVDIDLTGSGLVFEGKIYFLFSQGWKQTSGNTYLYRSDTGNLNDWGAANLYGAPFHTFTNVQNGLCMAESEGHLYLGVGGPLVGSVVYRMDEEEAPSAPSNCVAHFVVPDKSYCTWTDNSDNETGFRVEYSINEGAWTFFENKGVNATQSSQKQFTIGSNVKWRVRAYNVEGDSAWATSGSVYIGTGVSDRLMYGVDNTEDLILARAANCKVVFCTNFDSKTPADQIAYMNEAKTLGLQVTWNLWGGDWEYRTETILRWKDDPVVFAWYYITEPYNPDGGCYLTTAEQEVRYNYFKNIIGETEIPYMQDRGLFNPHLDYWYEDGLDILMVYSYAYEFPDDLDWIYDRMFGNLITLKTRAYPIIPNIQCFWAGDYTQPPPGAVQDQYGRWEVFLKSKGWFGGHCSFYRWTGYGGNDIKNNPYLCNEVKILSSGGVFKKWITKADFEAGELNNILVPEGLNRLELKRLALTGTGTWIFDGGPGRKFNWLSFVSTKPNQNVFYRDDFRDNSLEAWTIVGGTWEAVNQCIKGSGNLSWETNRIRVGPTSWQGLDILCKTYLSGTGLAHTFYLRPDTQGLNVNSYGLQTCSEFTSRFRVANGEVLEDTQLEDYGCPVATWCWIRVQIYTEGGDVKARIKWWALGEGEPGWEVSTTWSGIWRGSGCFGLGRHTTSVIGYYDNVLISRKEGMPDPANCSVSFKFWTSTNATTWGTSYTDMAKVPNSRFLKIEATLSRTSLLSAMPTIEDMTLKYRLFAQPIFI